MTLSRVFSLTDNAVHTERLKEEYSDVKHPPENAGLSCLWELTLEL